MNSEDAFDLSQDRRVTHYSAFVGSAWSGTLRGVLQANLANGASYTMAECVSPNIAVDLSQLLNLAIECKTPEQRRDVKARQEIMDLIELSEMLPGRDNKNNWKKKLEWLKEQFQQDGCITCDYKEGCLMFTPEGTCKDWRQWK